MKLLRLLDSRGPRTVRDPRILVLEVSPTAMPGIPASYGPRERSQNNLVRAAVPVATPNALASRGVRGRRSIISQANAAVPVAKRCFVSSRWRVIEDSLFREAVRVMKACLTNYRRRLIEESLAHMAVPAEKPHLMNFRRKVVEGSLVRAEVLPRCPCVAGFHPRRIGRSLLSSLAHVAVPRRNQLVLLSP